MTRCITITKYINKHKDVFMYLLTIRFIRKEKDKDEFLLRVLISHSCKILFILYKMYKAQEFNGLYNHQLLFHSLLFFQI